MYVFILWDTAIMMFMTKMLLLSFECGSMTGTALKNSETYHVSGFDIWQFPCCFACLPSRAQS